MGSPEGEPGRDPFAAQDETQHAVTLTGDYEILSTEVTQAGFSALMGYSPSVHAACDSCPVENVSWHQAAAYSNALSDAAALGTCYDCAGSDEAVTCEPSGAYATPYDCPGYRLPTEAEWEYAARAGTSEGTYNGTSDAAHLACEQPNEVLDSIAWFCGNADDVATPGEVETTHEVGTRDPNDWGLYDSLGNVWEWCHDWYAPDMAVAATNPWGPGEGSSRVSRGGSWYYDAYLARAALRNFGNLDDRGGPHGFRLARSLP